MTVRTIDEIFRDFVTDGVPASGPFNPHKPDIRDTLKALTEGSDNFPDNRVIRLNNADEGTANNIVVTASVAIPAAAYQVLYILNVTQENTGPVTVSGAINRDLVTNINQPIAPGYLIPGMALLCIDTGTELRLLSYGDAEAILAAAEDAAARAEAAAAGLNLPSTGTGDKGKALLVNSDATGYTLGFVEITVDTRSDLKALPVFFKTAYLLEAGREGTFVLKAGSPPVTDTQEGVYVVSDTAGYYWERVYAPKVGPDVNMFGADPSGVADSSPAFQGAANFGGVIIIPSAPYRLNTTITITKSGTKFLGNGPGTSVLTTYSPGHGIAVNSGLSYVELEGFRLLRNGVPSSATQNGIHFTGITERARISRVNCEGHWHNFRLCATSLSRVENIFSDNAYGNGIEQTNEDLVAAGMQWEMNYPFIQRSNGYGHRIYSNFGTTSNIATIRGWWSFANKLGGVYVQGQATHPINGCRWIDGFSGEEGSDSMRIDSYGTVDVQISGVQTEINGTLPCGVNNSTPATGTGRGITITANNTNVFITGCTALGHSYSGIVTSCPRYTITGCTVRANGSASVAGNRTGIHLAAGHGTCTGNTSWGQQFGIYFEGDTHTIVGNDVSEGNTTPIGGTVTPTNSKIGLNFGSTVITSL